MSDSSEPTREEKIKDALSAAPPYIAESATVVDWDMKTILREGSPDWICVPTPPGKPTPGPMCLDPTWMQWLMEVSQGKTPTIDRIGISYMLMGETGADFDNLQATHPPEGKDWYRAGPHEMFVFPAGSGHILTGIGHDTSSGLPYVRRFQALSPCSSSRSPSQGRKSAHAKAPAPATARTKPSFTSARTSGSATGHWPAGQPLSGMDPGALRAVALPRAGARLRIYLRQI